MVFFSNAQGTNVQIVADPVNQGSVNANEVIFAGPFAPSNTVTVTYRTPGGISLTPRILSLVDGAQIIDGVEYNAWTGLLDAAVTEFAGTVTAMFSVTASEGTTIVTNPAYFEVHEGVYVAPPADPSADVWGEVLSALTTVKESVDNVRKDTDDNAASITALDGAVSSHSIELARLSSVKLDKQTGETANHMVYAKTPEGAQEMLPFPSGTLANIKDGVHAGSLEQLGSDAQGEYDTALGTDNTTGVKGYYIAGVYFSDNQTIFILDYTFWPQITVVPTSPVPDEETPTPEWTANDVALFTFSRDVTLTAPIQNVDHNLLYIGQNLENVVPTTRVTDERSNSNSVCIPSKPTAGHAKLTNGGASTGTHNIAAGNNATVSGEGNIAGGDCSDVGGLDCVGNAPAAFVRGIGASATGIGSHAEGLDTKASAKGSHAEGWQSVASGQYSHAEGQSNATAWQSHAENVSTASGEQSHSEGAATASGRRSHAEGSEDALAKGYYSHAEGGGKAYGGRSHAEGSGRTGQPTGEADAWEAHAEGAGVALGVQSHAEGNSTVASGAQSHAEGISNTASGRASHAQGIGNTASAEGQFVAGRYSKKGQNGIGGMQPDEQLIVRVGAGTSGASPWTVFSIDNNGTTCMSSAGVNTGGIVAPWNVINKEYADANYAPIGGGAYTAAVSSENTTHILPKESTVILVGPSGEYATFDPNSGMYKFTNYGTVFEMKASTFVAYGATDRHEFFFAPAYATTNGSTTTYYTPVYWYSEGTAAYCDADGTENANGAFVKVTSKMHYVVKS
jgi:hypothetical protein